jgi:hypothetical protein
MKAVTFLTVALMGVALYLFASEMQVGLLSQSLYIPPRY